MFQVCLLLPQVAYSIVQFLKVLPVYHVLLPLVFRGLKILILLIPFPLKLID